MAVQPGRTAHATAPAHVTGAFRTAIEARDPRARGSIGVGLVLDARVQAVAEWHPARHASVALRADVPGPLAISQEVARRLLAHRPGRLTVRVRHPLPIGQGFAMSASAAVAIGLAVADVVRVPRSRAITVAHLADMFGGGGLGGVPSILGGGLEFRQRPGIPPFGRIVRRPYRAQVLLGVVGSLAASPQFVWNARTVARISEAFDRVSDRWVPLTPDGFWDASEEFTDRLGLAPPTLRSALRAIRRRGGRAAQTMYGHSFFALLPSGRRRGELLAWLARQPVRAVEVPVARTGAARQRVAA